MRLPICVCVSSIPVGSLPFLVSPTTGRFLPRTAHVCGMRAGGRWRAFLLISLTGLTHIRADPCRVTAPQAQTPPRLSGRTDHYRSTPFASLPLQARHSVCPKVGVSRVRFSPPDVRSLSGAAHRRRPGIAVLGYLRSRPALPGACDSVLFGGRQVPGTTTGLWRQSLWWMSPCNGPAASVLRNVVTHFTGILGITTRYRHFSARISIWLIKH